MFWYLQALPLLLQQLCVITTTQYHYHNDVKIDGKILHLMIVSTFLSECKWNKLK